MKKFILGFTFVLSTAAFAGPGCPGLQNSPYYGKQGGYLLWNAGDWPSTGPVDHDLSIAVGVVNYVPKKARIKVEIVQKDAAGTVVPFTSTQRTLINYYSMPACASMQTGVIVHDEAPAGKYTFSAKMLDGSQGGLMEIELD